MNIFIMKKKKLFCLISATLFAVGSATFASAAEEKKESYFIGFQNDQALEGFVDMMENPGEGVFSVNEMTNFSVSHTYQETPAVVASLTAEEARKLQEAGGVSYVEKDALMTISRQTTPENIMQIGAPAAHRRDLSGEGVKVAVLDTGIANHPDLRIAGGVSFIDGESYTDKNGHGTHVAGTIAARDNHIGVVGVAPDADLYAVNVLGSAGSALTSVVIQGIEWAIENDMDIVNLSLGSNAPSRTLEAAVDAARENDVLVVAASGNDGHPFVSYPARYLSVLSVGAVDENNRRASFSQYGSGLDIVAPGVDVLSTYLDGSYVRASGTSMATPAVTGAAALLKEKHPAWTASQIEMGLLTEADSLRSRFEYGYGLLNADRATR
ncbi:S8 family peptidase [Bacillus sp. FSL W7-1360]